MVFIRPAYIIPKLNGQYPTQFHTCILFYICSHRASICEICKNDTGTEIQIDKIQEKIQDEVLHVTKLAIQISEEILDYSIYFGLIRNSLLNKRLLDL